MKFLTQGVLTAIASSVLFTINISAQTCNPVNIPYAEDFNIGGIPICASSVNQGLGNSWQFNNGNMHYQYNQYYAAQGWFFTRAVNLASGINYRLSFQYMGGDPGLYYENVAVYFGRGASPAMERADSGINFLTVIQTTNWLTSESDFTVPVSGVYYIGFYCFSPADQSSLSVDNISLTASPQQYNYLRLSAFFDTNLDSVKQANEPYLNHGTFSAVKGNTTIEKNSTGANTTLRVDTGTYSSSYHYSANFVVVPATHTSTFPVTLIADTFSFAVQPIPNRRDVSVVAFPLGGARPGFNSTYHIQYSNQGTDTAANEKVTFVKSSRQSFVSAVPPPASVSGDTLKWNIASLTPFSVGDLTMVLKNNAPPSLNVGDTITLTAAISSQIAELNSADNVSTLRQMVRGSFDPNDKVENHGGTVRHLLALNGEDMVYTIRFQNTGTDTAFNISIRDTLSNKLDQNSIEVIAASHSYQFAIKDGKCIWTFPNILLADSNTNEAASHGYLVYRIKPNNTVQVGDVIKNSASIFFDYNLPVVTNIETTTVIADVLPVKLLTFTAKAMENGQRIMDNGKCKVQLKWASGNEMNFDLYEVERSSDGRAFNRIENVKGKMQNGKNEYSYIDYSPFPITYYRLKMIDKDGSFTYSKTEKASLNTQHRTLNITIRPNPVKDVLQAEIRSDKKAVLQMQVVSPEGRLLISRQVSVNEGTSLHTINVLSLQSGSYFLKVTADDKEQSVMKFEKM